MNPVRRKTVFKKIRAEDLAALLCNKRAGISPELVEDVIYGCVSRWWSCARTTALIAGFLLSSVQRLAMWIQQAVHFAAQAIISGDDVVTLVALICPVPIGSNMLDVQPAES